MKYLGKNISELHELLYSKTITPLDLVKECIEECKKDNTNAFEYILEKEAIEEASKLVEPTNDLLWGIPFACKDNFSTKNVPTCGSSNILEGYVPIYDATVITRLKERGAILVAKTTLDELAMGGSGMTGHKGRTYNPYDKSHTRKIGGSSCGSASITASGIVPFAIGSDTGDSVRKPASYAGLVGFKPSWGRISRYGLFPFATSLDHVAYFTRNVYDSALLLNTLAGRDDNDSTSSFIEVKDYIKNINNGVKGLKIAIIKEIEDSISDKDIINCFNKTKEDLINKGALIEYVNMDENLLKALFPVYFVISCCEATSNNANLDGIKFGKRYKGDSYQDVMKEARTNGFGELIKRRFVLGSYSLLKENQEDLFIRAQKIRHIVVDKINEIFNSYDAIYLPAAPSVAPEFDGKSDQLSNEYLIADNHLCIGNFGGFPSLTLPIGFKNDLPYGANIMCKPFNEELVFTISKEIENSTGLKDVYAGGKR